MKRKCWLAGLLALLLGLTACSSKPKTVHKVDFQTAPAYIAEDVPLPVQTGDLIGCCTDGEAMFILVDEQIEEEIESTLFRVSLTDGKAEVLTLFQSETIEDCGKNTIGPLLAPDGTLWLYEMQTIVYYDLPEDFDPDKDSKGDYYTGQDDFHFLRQLDPETGREKKIIDLSDAVRTLEVDDISDVAGVAVDGKGNFYFAASGGVGVLDKNMNYLFTLKAAIPHASINSSSGGPLVLLPDGAVAALTVQPGGDRLVRTIDPDAKGWGKSYELGGGADLLYNGSNGFLFYYTVTNALYAWEPEAEAPRKLMEWTATGLDGSVMCFAPLDGGRLAVLTKSYAQGIGVNYWYTSDIRLSMLNPSNKRPDAGKVKLVYGTIGGSYNFSSYNLKMKVNQFNKDNDRYYIEIRDYMEGLENTAESRQVARNRLNAEVVSGQIPDIWDWTLPIDLYARKGVLEDLWPMIDSDPEISRDNIMSHVLDCASVDGKLYKIGNTFCIETLTASSAIVGNRMSWTVEELMDYWEDMPEDSRFIDAYFNKELVLAICVDMDEGRWVDWNTGECRFDSDEFKRVLEFSNQATGNGEFDYETDDTQTAILEGRQFLASQILSRPLDLIRCEAMYGGPDALWDYEAMLNENGIVPVFGDAAMGADIYCHALNAAQQAREMGRFFLPLAADATFGAIKGGGHAAYIGYPSENGVGSVFTLDDTMAISSSCADKEGAWSFIRQLLLPGGSVKEVKWDEMVQYETHGFPMNKADFESLLEPQWFTYVNGRKKGEYILDQNGNKIEKPFSDSIWEIGNPVAIGLYALSPNEEIMEQFWELYNAIDRLSTSSELEQIILEQAQPYFSGDKSLDETADLIQRRASLYVNENR